MENTFQFILYPYETKFVTPELNRFMLLGIDNLEMEIIEIQSSIVWKNKFKKLISEVEKKNQILFVLNARNICVGRFF